MKALYAQVRHIVSIKVYDKEIEPYYTWVDEEKEIKTYESFLHKLTFSPTIKKTRETGYTQLPYKEWTGYRQIKTAEKLREENYLVRTN